MTWRRKALWGVFMSLALTTLLLRPTPMISSGYRRILKLRGSDPSPEQFEEDLRRYQVVAVDYGNPVALTMLLLPAALAVVFGLLLLLDYRVARMGKGSRDSDGKGRGEAETV